MIIGYFPMDAYGGASAIDECAREEREQTVPVSLQARRIEVVGVGHGEPVDGAG